VLDVKVGPRGGLAARARSRFEADVMGLLLLGRGSHFGDECLLPIGTLDNKVDNPYFSKTSRLSRQRSCYIPPMETVYFITAENDETDLIVSFAVQEPDDPQEIATLCLMRTPKYEQLLDPDERGVSVSFERDPDNDVDFRVLLEEVRYSERDRVLEIKSARRRYRLDVRKVEPEEIVEMGKVLHKMNFDGRFRLTGI
jgi:hypothetical protein